MIHVYLLGSVQLFFDVSVCALRCPVFLANRKSYTKNDYMILYTWTKAGKYLLVKYGYCNSRFQFFLFKVPLFLHVTV